MMLNLYKIVSCWTRLAKLRKSRAWIPLYLPSHGNLSESTGVSMTIINLKT